MANRGAYHRRGTRRSSREWGARIFLAIVILAIGWAGVSQSIASVLQKSDPAVAYRFTLNDGRVTAILARSLSGVDARPADRALADRLGRKALRQDPTAVVAVSTLGFDAQLRGQTAEAQRLFGYAEALSRRDLQTQVWAIENSVAQGDVAAALHHYDIALRTSPDAQAVLFPILASAISTQPVRAALTNVLKDQPVWGVHFLSYVAGQGEDLRAASLLLDMLRRAKISVQKETSSQLVDRLAATASPAEAWSLYTSLHSPSDPRRSRDPSFLSTTAPTIFDWKPVADTGIAVAIQPAGQGGLVDFSAAAGAGGAALEQMQVLPPGAYQIRGHSIGIDQSDNALPYWKLVCTNGREVGRVVVPKSMAHGGMFAGQFAVPKDCPAQMLTLVIRPSDAVAGATGQIDRLLLSPVS